MHGLRVLPVLLLSALLAALPARAAAGDDPAGSDKTAEVMAAFVFNFARFVEWPEGTFPATQNPLVVCATGTDALGGHLLRLHGREAQGRRVAVRILAAGEDPAGCQMLYLTRQDADATPAWLAAVGRRPVLTISSQPGFSRRGGDIGLFVAGDSVKFSIARERAEGAGLRIGSRLLALAQDPPGGGR